MKLVFGGDTSPNKWSVEHAKGANFAIHKAFATPEFFVKDYNYPLKYFAERIGGPHVKVILPVPSGQDPVYWTPTIADITAYQQSDLILLNGAGYAKWVKKVSLPRSKTVDTSRQLKER